MYKLYDMENDITERITAIAKEMCKKGKEISHEDSLQKKHGFDSIDMVDLTMRIEKEFDISIHDYDAPGLKTVKDFSDYVENLFT